MTNLRELITDAEKRGVAIGHFNISNVEGFWAIVRAAESVGVPVIIGVSEGERDFIGVRQAKALVESVKLQAKVPVFINADHTYSLERIKETVDAGYDSVIVDGSKMTLEENVAMTREAVAYAKSKNVLVEGELGYIGTSSKLLDALPEGVKVDGESLVQPEAARQFVADTGVELLAPAVGNVHGMIKSGEPALNIARIKEIRQAAGVPLVLHGASGNSDADIRAAIAAGVAIVHINTELRVAYRDALKLSLQENPDEVAPYKILKPAITAMQKVVETKLRLFNNLV